MTDNQPSLYSYVLRYDDGAAPNPFWGVCTLVICKPVIRRCAKVGDWIIGTGSANSPIGDIRNSIVYVMKVTEKIPLLEYDAYTNSHIPNKIPDWFSGNPRLMVGDSIYDFSHDPPKQRKGVHKESERDSDLSGLYALLSNHFYYFGDNPYPIPEHLHGLIMRNQGHRSESNIEYHASFHSWLDDQGLKSNHLYGKPQGKLFQEVDFHPGLQTKCWESKPNFSHIARKS